MCENLALSPLGERVACAGVFTSRRGTGLRPPKGKRRAVNNIGIGPQEGEGVPTCLTTRGFQTGSLAGHLLRYGAPCRAQARLYEEPISRALFGGQSYNALWTG